MRIAVIDIGGTFIKHGVFENGAVTEMGETPTNAQQGAAAMLETVCGIVKQMRDIDYIGIDTAGEVDPETHTVRSADNIPGYNGLCVREFVESRVHIPCAVENDVNAQALGELHYGAAQNQKNFLMVSYGTGVGGAVVIGGEIYRGIHNSAAEFGGILTHPEALSRGGKATYEANASTTALVRSVSAQFAQLTDGRAIFAHMDDPRVKALVDGWINEVSYGLTSLIQIFNPGLIVLGGGILREAYITDKLAGIMMDRTRPSFHGFRLAPSKLGNRAGLFGAAVVAQRAAQKNRK